ncbi:MAG: hypothetical protein QXH80_03820, partial [Candidatus Nanoarchaeia archaeon]
VGVHSFSVRVLTGFFMYNWRKITEEQRTELLELRKAQKRPWHSPPHIKGDKTRFIISSACYEHREIIGHSSSRMSSFENELLSFFKEKADEVYAWVILPNHYHILLKTMDILGLIKSMGQFHGRISFHWNNEEACRGRRVWCNTLERAIKSDRHFYAALNYIHHNPVKHGYVRKWTEWPFSSAEEYLRQIGREQALKNWKEYDIQDMGENWDGFEEHAEAVNSDRGKTHAKAVNSDGERLE